jgi:hypothetical protein
MRVVLVLFMVILVGCSGGEDKMADTSGVETGDGSDVEKEKTAAVFNVDESYPGGAPASQFNPETGRFETNLPGQSTSAPVDLAAPELSGGIGVEKPKEAEPTPTKIETPTPREGSGTESRKRRRSLLLEEEGGLLSPFGTATVKKRSLFGT